MTPKGIIDRDRYESVSLNDSLSHQPHSPIPWTYRARSFCRRGTGLNQPAVPNGPHSLADGCFQAYCSMPSDGDGCQ